MVYEAFKGLIFFGHHAHIELHLILGMFCGEVLHQLYCLSLCEPSVFYMDTNVLQPGLENKSC